jgi:hypothetical protein
MDGQCLKTEKSFVMPESTLKHGLQITVTPEEISRAKVGTMIENGFEHNENAVPAICT